MLKAIVMDMDGTLLNKKDEITPLTLNALKELQKQGVKLILASGRNYRRLIGIANTLNMNEHGGYFIEIDGVVIYDMVKNERNILHQMTVDEVKDLYAYLKNETCETQICLENGVYAHIPEYLYPLKKKTREEMNVPEDFPWTAGPWGWIFDMRKAYGTVYYMDEVEEVKGFINKIQIMDTEENIQRIHGELSKRFPTTFEFFRTSHRQIEILSFGYSKGKTLKRIMDLNGWNRDEVVAFGDGENDVSLFAEVENSFAMGQAMDYVKKQARYVTKTNNEDGIYHALKQLGYIK